MSGEHAAPWPTYALPFGTVVHGFTIQRFLGSGGFGVTYLARDAAEQTFAIKEYFPRDFAVRQDLTVVAAAKGDTETFKDCLERFEREARALVRLSNSPQINDGIVGFVTFFKANGTAFLVMKHVEGINLRQLLDQHKAGLDAERVSSLLAQLLSSVDAVHRAGLFHRDIKPANIMMRGDGRAVLIDFGSSREATVNPNLPHTQIYTAGYSPYEQMVGQPQKAFSDIYAIGAVCYHAIGGKPVSATIRYNNVLAKRPDPMPSAELIGNGRYPVSLLRAIDAALAIDPKQRPQNAQEMLAIFQPDVRARSVWNKLQETRSLVLAGAIAFLIVALPLASHFGNIFGGAPSGAPSGPGSAPPRQPVGNGPVPGSRQQNPPAGQTAGQPPARQPPWPNLPEFQIDVASEQAILDHDFTEADPEPAVYRFEPNRNVLVLDFKSLGGQGRMLNRVAALIEKIQPHDHVLDDHELAAAIAAGGDTPETYNYAHDYSAASLARFFEFADRDDIKLSNDEETLRRLIRQEGWFEPSTRGGLISIPRIGADGKMTHAARAAILLHQLSLAEYFTNPDYNLFVHRFWTQTLTVAECDRIRRFLRDLGYDPNLDEVMENEAQGYLMFTASAEYFKPNLIGMSPARLAELRAGYFKSMPPGWLRARLGQILDVVASTGFPRH